ncbi:hypothetical protein G5714_008641 [Onychostoma macrolepis]|uniref:Ig-like domain-containing protein n=1 Tax=Onychostoma macrolepis TaxID=369639 RepID=A0A7J6CWG6_9TELE|nr:hypothetical protein G5714_008641 [Onychostoma macrolepis]
MGSSALPLMLLLMSFIHAGLAQDSPRSTLTVTPDRPVFTGETVTLKCEIESHSDWRWRIDQTHDSGYDWTPEWRYEWFKDSVMLQTSGRYTVNRDTLTIRGATESDQGQYWCRGHIDRRSVSSQSSSVSLSVEERPKPVVKVTPDQRVFRGETVTLTCDIQPAGHIQWRYSWFKDGDTQYPVYTTTTAEFSFTADYVSDSVTYSCRGERSDSQRSDISAAVTLTVSDLPRSTLTVTPDRPVFTGETVTLTCVIESDHSDWRYEWYKDRYSAKLQMSDRYTVNRDTLTIRGATVSDQGQYWCRGQRDRRSVSSQSSSASLSVKDSPRSTLTVTQNNPVFTGETVTLTCAIESHSDWRYEWYKDRYSAMLQTSDGYTVNRDTLTIRGATESDQGQYWCRGQRDERPQSSQSSSAVSLSVTERPKPVVKVTPDQRVFRGETVTLTCDIQPAGHIQWRYSWFKDGSVIRDVTERVYSITSVSDSVTYSCRGDRSDSQRSDISAAVTLTVSDLKPKPELASYPAGAALTGNTVTLTCRMDPAAGWDFYWNKHTLNSETKTETNSYRVQIDSVSDGGQYWCRAGRGKPVYYTQYSDALWVNITVSPKAVVTVRPDERVFRGETVALRCDIKWGGDTEWTYRWEIEGTNWYKNSADRCTEECSTSETDNQKNRNAVGWCLTQELNISSVDHVHSGKYTCRGQKNTQCSQRSDAVTLTVSAEARAAVRVSPQPWLTEGDSVTLICEVTGSSTGWTFSWFRDDDRLSDSSRGAAGSYTLSPAALQHTGVYTCRAERGRPAYYTNYTQTLWITGVSPSVSLEVSPSRSQHFSSDSLSLSCEDQSNSAGWTVRRYTDRNTEDCSKQTGSTCRIVSLSTSDSGVYWCQSESGEKRHPLNITVHDGDVILGSSVDPNQTTGEMNITTVSKSHEGFYSCKTERGASPKSWISVRVSAASSLLLVAGVVLGLLCLLIFISLLLLLWRYKKNKGSDQICDVVTEVNKRHKDGPEPLADVTYSEVTVKKNKKKMDKDDSMAEPNEVTYSEVRKKVKKSKSKDINTAGPSDLVYAQIDLQDKKKTKSKGAGLRDFFIEMKSKDKQRGKSSESGDTLYSELKHNTDRGADASDATYAQPIRKKNKTRP